MLSYATVNESSEHTALRGQRAVVLRTEASGLVRVQIAGVGHTLPPEDLTPYAPTCGTCHYWGQRADAEASAEQGTEMRVCHARQQEGFHGEAELRRSSTYTSAVSRCANYFPEVTR